MSSAVKFRTLILAAAAATLTLSSATLAPAQSGTLVGKAKSKVTQAQGATPTTAEPSAQAPVPAPSGEHAGLTVIGADPNHLSAVKALEQIRRDEEASSEGTTFSYDPGDRRDPFLSPQDVLLAQMTGNACQGEGIECWLIQDVTVIGVLTRKSGNVALVIGPDGYGTTLHEGDKLYDGDVRRIDPETGLVVFRQKINDPTRIKPFRDVEKGLNLTKEGRS
ncbi:MAG TPA: hypothetical protein VGK94_13005 [Candidatus Polarisedimenticolia bacterium]|jgi:Tfp pilus assembly protein PilP